MVLPTPLFTSPEESRVAQLVYGELEHFHRLPSSAQLQSAAQQSALVERVRAKLTGGQLDLGATPESVDIAAVVNAVTSAVVGTVIDVPRILLQPLGETVVTYDDVPLPSGGFEYVMPEHDIVVRELQSRERFRIAANWPATSHESKTTSYRTR